MYFNTSSRVLSRAVLLLLLLGNCLLSESIMFYVDLSEGEPEDAEDIIKKSIEEIHKSAKGTLYKFCSFILFYN